MNKQEEMLALADKIDAARSTDDQWEFITNITPYQLKLFSQALRSPAQTPRNDSLRMFADLFSESAWFRIGRGAQGGGHREGHHRCSDGNRTQDKDVSI